MEEDFRDKQLGDYEAAEAVAASQAEEIRGDRRREMQASVNRAGRRAKYGFTKQMFKYFVNRELSSYQGRIKSLSLELARRAVSRYDIEPLLDSQPHHDLCQLTLRLERDSDEKWKEIVANHEGKSESKQTFHLSVMQFVMSFAEYAKTTRLRPFIEKFLKYDGEAERNKLKQLYKGSRAAEMMEELDQSEERLDSLENPSLQIAAMEREYLAPAPAANAPKLGHRPRPGATPPAPASQPAAATPTVQATPPVQAAPPAPAASAPPPAPTAPPPAAARAQAPTPPPPPAAPPVVPPQMRGGARPGGPTLGQRPRQGAPTPSGGHRPMVPPRPASPPPAAPPPAAPARPPMAATPTPPPPAAPPPPPPPPPPGRSATPPPIPTAHIPPAPDSPTIPAQSAGGLMPPPPPASAPSIELDLPPMADSDRPPLTSRRIGGPPPAPTTPSSGVELPPPPKLDLDLDLDS